MMNGTVEAIEVAGVDVPALEAPQREIVLGPGDHIVTVAFERPPPPPDELSHALERLGFEAVALDQYPVEGSLVQFMGTLRERALCLQGTDAVRWVGVHTLSFDPFANMTRKPRELNLEAGRRYELRFLSWLPTHKTRGDVEAGLSGMHFRASELIAIKRNMRLPDRPGANVTIWIAHARYIGPRAIVTIEEPFFFEDLIMLPEPG
jgi:hypothetical protein